VTTRFSGSLSVAQEIGVTFEPDPRGKLARLNGRDLVLKRENSMTRTLIIATTLAGALLSSSVFTQERSHDTASVPDFSGVWGNPYLYGIEPPLAGPGPVVNKSRRRQVLDVDGRPLLATNAPLVSDARQLVGDYTNPILKPEAAEVVKKHAEMSLAGAGYPSPRNQCWPQGVPFIFTNFGMQMLQQPVRITILYDEDHEVRHVRMNHPHPAQVTPSWYGDSVGHYEGDTLVIDTVGIKVGPLSAVDQYGTPYTQALHVVERYRLIDSERAREAQQRGGQENARGGGASIAEGWAADPNYKGKGLQLQFTVEDEGVFTTAWSATKTYRRVFRDWPENVCAENPHKYNTEKDAAVPTADKPDF
jgi:hypothetical protein